MGEAKAGRPDLSKQTRLDSCLLVALETHPTLALTGSCPGEQFRMGERLYKDQGYGDWTGFYDWLRKDSDRIVGVRYCPFEATEFLIETVARLEYVVIPERKRCIEVYFSIPSPGADPRKSDDQTFGSNKIFFCQEQTKWLISFDTTRLSESEMQSIRAANVRWEPVSALGSGDAREIAQSAGA